MQGLVFPTACRRRVPFHRKLGVPDQGRTLELAGFERELSPETLFSGPSLSGSFSRFQKMGKMAKTWNFKDLR